MQYYESDAMPPSAVGLHSARDLATAASVLLAVTAAVYLFAVYAGFALHGVTGDPWSHSRAEVRHADALHANAGHLQMLALLPTATVFIIWFHRVRTNADFFAADACTRGRGWAIGGWFIPIGFLWIPYRIASEIWAASARSAPDGSWRSVSQRPLTAWWGVWLTSVLISRMGSALSTHAGTLTELHRATGFVIFADALGVAAAILAIVFVQKLTAMQEVKATRVPYASS